MAVPVLVKGERGSYHREIGEWLSSRFSRIPHLDLLWRFLLALLRGGASFRRFSVPTQLPDGLEGSLSKRIQRHAFRELTPEDEDRPSAGWAVLDNPLETDFTEANCIFDNHIGLAYRVEKRTVQPLRLQGRMRSEEARILDEEGLEVVPRGRLREIKENVMLALLAETTPRIAVHELIWAKRNGLLVVGSTSTNLVAEIRDLFERTFEVQATPLFPYALAGHLGVTAGSGASLDAIDQAILVPDMARRIRAAEEARIAAAFEGGEE